MHIELLSQVLKAKKNTIMKSTTLSLILFLLISPFVYGQAECAYYHKKNCGNKDNFPMKYDSQSKSAILGKGQISEFHMVAYGGLDYRINICAEDILGSQVQFKIYEKKRELVKQEEEEIVYTEGESSSDESYSDDSYSDDYSSDSYDDYSDAYSDDMGDATSSNKPKFKLVKELLYDNAQDNFSNQLEFTAENSMSLIIEVSVPGDGSKSKLKIREMGCVGVLIEHIKSRQAGFH